MHTLNKKIYALAMCLSALAGCVDAIGFLHLGGYFISFMSGNSTRLAVNLVSGNLPAIALLAGILALFVSGTLLGVLVRHFSPLSFGPTGVLGFVTLLLTSAALSHVMGADSFAIVLITLAMGAENAVLQRNGDVVVGLTYMTGTLVKVGQRLADAMLGGAPYAWAPYLLLWLGLMLGGVTGTLLFTSFGLQSLWIAALWAGGLTLITTFFKHHVTI